MRCVAELAAIEADVVRAEAGGERRDVEQLGVEPRNLEPEVARPRVPVEGEEAVDLLEIPGPFFNRGRGAGRRWDLSDGTTPRAEYQRQKQRAARDWFHGGIIGAVAFYDVEESRGEGT